jgi:hypothetical protein
MPDYLEDIKKDHEDNFADIMSGCISKSFPSTVYAYEYRMHCVEKAFRDLGFSPQELVTASTSMETASQLIDQALVSRNIRVEDWSEHPEKDRRGLYIYKDEEIAYFVALVRQTGDNYIVKSNVKFE